MSDETCGQCFTHHPGSLCPSPAHRLDPTLGPPEESLCGEEEDLVTGNTTPPAPVLPADQWSAGSEAWLRHCQQVGRNRVRAYDEAFSLVQAQFTAWRGAFPAVADEVNRKHCLGPLTPGEREVQENFADGFAGFLTHLRAVTQNVVGGGR